MKYQDLHDAFNEETDWTDNGSVLSNEKLTALTKGIRAETDGNRFRPEVRGEEIHVWLEGSVGSFFGARNTELVAALQGHAEKPMVMHGNSPGGSYFEGVAIANTVAEHPGGSTFIVEGLTGSAATLPMMASDRAEMAEGTQILVHNSSALVMGKRKDMERAMKLTENVDRAMASIYTEGSSLTRKQVEALMDEDRFMDADEAVAKGFVDAKRKKKKKDKNYKADGGEELERINAEAKQRALNMVALINTEFAAVAENNDSAK